MSITVNNIISPNIIRLQNIVTSQSSQLQQLIDLYSDKNKRSYDQTTKQNVSSISFDQSTQLYRFEIENKENDTINYINNKKIEDLQLSLPSEMLIEDTSVSETLAVIFLSGLFALRRISCC